MLVTLSLLPSLREQHRVDGNNAIDAVYELLSREDVRHRFSGAGGLTISAFPAKLEFGDGRKTTDAAQSSVLTTGGLELR